MKKILNNILYFFIILLGKFLTWLLFKLKAEGKDNLPPRGPFIIVANHTSFVDPLVMQSVVQHNISWITRKDVYNIRPLRFILNIFNCIPVNGSLERALQALDEGRIVGIFPEGGRSPDGELKDASRGVAILALRSGKDIIPVGIKGAYEAFGRHMRFLKPHPVTLKIGRPFSFGKRNEDVIEDSILDETKDCIIDRIRELLI